MTRIGSLGDPDIRLGGHININIRLGGQLNMFPSISRLFLRRMWGPRSIAKLDGGHGRICSLDPPLNRPIEMEWKEDVTEDEVDEKWVMKKGCGSFHSFILKTYIAPLQETTTQRRSQPSHGQKRRT